MIFLGGERVDAFLEGQVLEHIGGFNFAVEAAGVSAVVRFGLKHVFLCGFLFKIHRGGIFLTSTTVFDPESLQLF